MEPYVESGTLVPVRLRERPRAAAADRFREAAGEVIEAHGCEKATMKEIARAGGCAAGTVPPRFRSLGEPSRTILERHPRECAGDVPEARRAGLVRTDLPAGELAALVPSTLSATFARWATSPDAPSSEERFHVLWGFLAGGLGARSTRR